MSDSIISLVPHQMEYLNPKEVKKKVFEWMTQNEIISQNQSDNTLSKNFGYGPGEKYKTILADSNNELNNVVVSVATNGVEFVTRRMIFHTYGNGIDEVLCSSCNQNLVDYGWADIVDDWYKGGSHNWECPQCGHRSKLNDYLFHTEYKFIWAFSNFGINFYNWPYPFSKEFIKQIEDLVGSKIKIVLGHI